MGSPDARQIDGIGGAHPLTSKVAIVSPGRDAGVDVDYLFLQVGVDDATVSDSQNCGNLLAAVGQFAVERGVVAPGGDTASVRIRMVNTESIATATFPLSGGAPVYDGTTAISGVPGTAAPVRLDFEDIAGGSCGALLPTGNAIDEVGGVACTLVDNGMPVVVMRADRARRDRPRVVRRAGGEPVAAPLLEEIRLQAGKLMNLGDVTATTVPKLTMVAPPQGDAALCTRSFIPHRCHDAIGVLGAVSVATAALLPGTPAASAMRPGSGDGRGGARAPHRDVRGRRRRARRRRRRGHGRPGRHHPHRPQADGRHRASRRSDG